MVSLFDRLTLNTRQQSKSSLVQDYIFSPLKHGEVAA